MTENLILKIRDRIEMKFAETALEPYPFPHLIIENLFPEDIFPKIIENNPFKQNLGEPWFSEQKSLDLFRKTGTPFHKRKQINFHTNHQFSANEQQQVFWDAIKNCFLNSDHWFDKLVFNKYKYYFIIRFGEVVDLPNFFDLLTREFFVQRHEVGYLIRPHTDIPTRIFTWKYGTELCVPKDPMVRCWGNGHYSPEDFIVKKIAPYKPNNFLLFFKTRQSFHSVRTTDETVPNQRYSMQFRLSEPEKGIFTELSEPDLLKSELRSVHNVRKNK